MSRPRRSGQGPARRRRRRLSPQVWSRVGLAVLIGVLLFGAGLWLGRQRTPPPPPGFAPTVSAPEQAEPPSTVAEPRYPAFEEELAAAPDLDLSGSDLPEPPPVVDGSPTIALVIDDLGRSVASVERLHRLGVPISYAVLPFETRTREVVAALRDRQAEILVHLPMEGSPTADPGPGALWRRMSPQELREATRAALRAVPGATGVNNHMGSVLSTDPRAMEAVLQVLAENGLFFLDSRTSAETVAYPAALALGVPAAERQVFLDGERDPEAIGGQFERALEIARQRGAVIVIGHPYEETMETLAAAVPRAVAAGYRFVPVSYLLDRAGGPQS